MRRVSGPEKFFGPNEKIGIMLAPTHAPTFAEVFFDPRDCGSHRLDYEKTTTDIKRTVLLCQSHGLLRREAVSSARRIVFNITTRRLVHEPLPHVTLVGVCSLCQFRWRCWATIGQRLVESQLLSEVNKRRTEGGAKVAHDFSQKRVHLVFVNCALFDCCRHNGPPALSVEVFPG